MQRLRHGGKGERSKSEKTESARGGSASKERTDYGGRESVRPNSARREPVRSTASRHDRDTDDYSKDEPPRYESRADLNSTLPHRGI